MTESQHSRRWSSGICPRDPNPCQPHLQFGPTWWWRSTLAQSLMETILVKITAVILGILASVICFFGPLQSSWDARILGMWNPASAFLYVCDAIAHAYMQADVHIHTQSKNFSCPCLRTRTRDGTELIPLIIFKFTLLQGMCYPGVFPVPIFPQMSALSWLASEPRQAALSGGIILVNSSQNWGDSISI